jgi:hypothetical protein
VRLDKRERTALLNVVNQLAPRLADPLAATPRAYEDAALQAEYDRWVRPEVEQGRDADIDVVRDSLSAGEDTLPLTEAQALSWLRAFNHLRLVAGQTLGIDADGWEEKTDELTRQSHEFGVLMALGYIQEELVAALES